MKIWKFKDYLNEGYDHEEDVDTWPNKPEIPKPASKSPVDLAKDMAVAARKFKSQVTVDEGPASMAWRDLLELIRQAESI